MTPFRLPRFELPQFELPAWVTDVDWLLVLGVVVGVWLAINVLTVVIALWRSR